MMAKKNYEDLEMLQVAVARIKKICAQDPGDNIKFSEALGFVERRLLDEMFEQVSQKFVKPSKRPQKTGMPEHRGASTTIKVSEKDGKPK